MPRNIAKPVTENEARYAAKVERLIAPTKDYRDIGLTYIKRDGTKGYSAGRVMYFSGTPGMDTHSVTLDTPDKGARTINLHRITHVE